MLIEALAPTSSTHYGSTGMDKDECPIGFGEWFVYLTSLFSRVGPKNCNS